MDYKETLQTLYSMLPDFQQVGADAYKPGLDRIERFADSLGNPHRKYKIIHVAGTNGKGSVSHMLASVLTAAGFRTGLYTSPHLRDFRERIRIDGETISEQEVVGFAGRNMDDMKRGDLSFFEATAAMAFDYFARCGVDVAVIETGLGGRLDATNIVTPVLSVITNIGLDHMQQLGDTPAAIAREKAGIIKRGIPVVIGEKDGETETVFRDIAARNESPVLFAEDRYQYAGSYRGRPELPDGECPGEVTVYRVKDLSNGTVRDYPSDLGGVYQRKNIITVLSAIELLRNPVGVDMPDDAVVGGLATAALSTGLRGRWEILCRSPLMVCDTGHNAHGISQVVEQIAGERFRRLYMVLGFVRDKDLSAILPLLPKDAFYIFTSPSIRRALPAEELAWQAAEHGLGGTVCDTVPEAVGKALALAGPEDMVFIGGSTFTVADIEMPVPDGAKYL